MGVETPRTHFYRETNYAEGSQTIKTPFAENSVPHIYKSQANPYLKAFFTNRKLYTEWNGVNSDTLDLFNYSCVQGSTIGATTFNFYTQDINDINDEDIRIIKYADDTNHIILANNPNELSVHTCEYKD